MDFEQSDSILKDYGLEHNFVSMDLIVKMGQPIEYWAPARSFPSVSLVQKLSKPVSVPMNQDLMRSADTSPLLRLPLEILEHIFSYMEKMDLLRSITVNHEIAAYALSRFYHSINIVRSVDMEDPCMDIQDCLRTLIECPHLASQVYTFQLKLNATEEDPQIFTDVRNGLSRVLKAISPTVYALHLNLFGSIHSLDYIPEFLLSCTLDFPRLLALKLGVMLRSTNLSGGIRAPKLVLLECGLGFALITLPHLPQLLGLTITVMDMDPEANETLKIFELKHPRLQYLSVVVNWGSRVRDIGHIKTRLSVAEKESDLPAVENLCFAIVSPTGVDYTVEVLEYFLPKTPNMVSILAEWSLDDRLRLGQWKKICPKFVICRMSDTFWIWDTITDSWEFWNQTNVQDAVHDLMADEAERAWRLEVDSH